jgi:bla regulator protein blaR1
LTYGLVAHLWQSTLCVGAAWLLALALRRNRAQVRYWIWFIASAKFLLPFSLLVSLGAFVPWRAAVPLSKTGWVGVAAEQMRPLVTMPAIGADVAANRANRSYALAALSLWFCGFATVALCWATRWKRIEELRRLATPLRVDRGLASKVPVMSAPGLFEPGVFGVIRPVVLLPAGITERLTQPQLKAILAHELYHVSRRDNLTAAIHMAVQGAFWFHPLVWWLGARLVDERERACDEEVLHLGNMPQVYAQGILNVCKLYLESPLLCLPGVTGSNLKRRIEAIMKNRSRRELSLCDKFLLAIAGLMAVAGPLAVGMMDAPVLWAQSGKVAAAAVTTSSLPLFEAASIKPSDPASQLKVDFARGGRLAVTHGTLRFLIKLAYDVSDDEITGGPAWLSSKRFDIQAVPDEQIPGDPSQMTDDQLRLFHQPTRLRLQRLLAERFRLELRKESKPMPIFALTIAKNGVKMKPDNSAGGPIMKGNTGVLEATRADMNTLARFLSERQTGRPVINMTALSGAFDFRLEWTPDPSLDPQADPTQPSSADLGGPSIFTALQQQLGLKLDARTGSAETLAVTHVELPSLN